MQDLGQKIGVNNYANSLRSRGTSVSKQTKIAGVKPKKRALVKAIQPKYVLAEQVEIGDIVLCKMRGFCPWPSRVIEKKNTMINVEFFGDHTTQKTSIKNIFKFGESAEALLANLKGRKDPSLAKAIREAEIVHGLPMSLVDL